MKKVAAAFVSLGVIVLIVGLVLVGIYGRDKISNGGLFHFFGGANVESANSGKDVTSSEYEGLTEIKIQSACYTVCLLPASGDILSVKYNEPFRDGENVTVQTVGQEEKVVEVTQTGGNNRWWLSDLFDRRFIAVYVPQTEAFADVKITVLTNGASVDVDEITCRYLNVETGAGSVNADSVRADEVSVKTSAGSVNLDEITCKVLSVSAEAGSVNVDEINAEQTDVATSAGSIRCGVQTQSLKLQSGAGSIRFDVNECNAIDVRSDAGSVKGEIHGVKHHYDVTVDHGPGSSNIESSHNGSADAKTLKVKVGVGSIKIEFDVD